MATPTQFRHYLIAQDSAGANLEVLRNAEQVAVFAFDSRRQIFVHCHVLLDPVEDQAAFEARARKLCEKGHPLRARVVEYGEDDSSAFYITENVDGETLRGYLERWEDIPVKLAAKVVASTLRALVALEEVGDCLPPQPLEALRIVQTGANTLAVVLADYQLVPTRGKNKPVTGKLASQVKFLVSWLREQMGKNPLVDDSKVRCSELLEQLERTVAAFVAAEAGVIREALAALEKDETDNQDGELSATLKPKAHLASMMANFQELARSVSQVVRIQSQKLTPAQPYALRGMYMKTGQTVVVEQLPPRRLAGNFPSVNLKQVQNLPKGRYPNLVPVVFLEHGDDVECMGEAAVEGVALNELLLVRGALDPQEVYVVLASMDAVLEQMEKAEVAAQRLRLEDIYLFTGFGKDAPLDTALLTTKLNEWPGFSIVARAHPCMHSMSGRGTDPGLLLPLSGPNKSGAQPLWNGAWMAALGCFLAGMPGGRAKQHETGIPQTDAVFALLEDEVERGRKGTPSPRATFLSRFARLVQKYELVQPKAAANTELSGVEPPQGAAREMARPVAGLPSRKGGPPPPMPPVGKAGGQNLEEQPALGFAEALIQKSSGEDNPLDEDEIALPPMRSGMRVAGGQVESSWMSVRSRRPLWQTALMVVVGALIVGAGLAHLTGRAIWNASPEDGDSRDPVDVSKAEKMKPVEIELPTMESVAPVAKPGQPTLPVPDKPLVKDLETLSKPPVKAEKPPVLAPPMEIAVAIPVAADPSLIGRLQDLRKAGGKLTPELRAAAEKAAKGGSSEAMLAMGRALLRGENGEVDQRGGFLWIEKAAAAGDASALLPLAECYLQGWGTPPDGAKAVGLLERARASGDAAAGDLLGVCYARGIGVQKDDLRAFELCSKAYNEGVVSACGNLGALYLRGQGTAPDAERAVQLFAEGARRGHAESMRQYAQCLEYGTGVLTDRVEASRWYQQAARLGNAEAADWCREKGVSF